MPMKQISKEENIHRAVENILKCVETGKKIGNLPPGVTISDLPENAQILYALSRGDKRRISDFVEKFGEYIKKRKR